VNNGKRKQKKGSPQSLQQSMLRLSAERIHRRIFLGANRKAIAEALALIHFIYNVDEGTNYKLNRWRF
jgi:hypothetical protein